MNRPIRPASKFNFTIRAEPTTDGEENVAARRYLGNVTIVDNLTTRLEFVPGSEQSSVKADFSTQPNEHGSLVLRWEIADPIKPGEGGAVRFKARVR